MRPDGRLSGQLKRMLEYRSDSAPPQTLSDHRIGPEFAFVKFVADQGFKGLADDELTNGYYFPATYVRDMLNAEPQGPRGGQVLHVTRDRASSPRVFASLVGDCWIGSRGDVSDVLAEVLNAPSASVTLAIDVTDGGEQA